MIESTVLIARGTSGRAGKLHGGGHSGSGYQSRVDFPTVVVLPLSRDRPITNTQRLHSALGGQTHKR
jgi:hypothetical protein